MGADQEPGLERSTSSELLRMKRQKRVQKVSCRSCSQGNRRDRRRTLSLSLPNVNVRGISKLRVRTGIHKARPKRRTRSMTEAA